MSARSSFSFGKEWTTSSQHRAVLSPGESYEQSIHSYMPNNNGADSGSKRSAAKLGPSNPISLNKPSRQPAPIARLQPEGCAKRQQLLDELAEEARQKRTKSNHISRQRQQPHTPQRDGANAP